MILLTKKEILENKGFYIDEIKKGKVFVYPTDTLLGLGADATNEKSVERIFAIKQRSAKPLLVIAPSWAWIKENCVINSANYNRLQEKLPGAYAFIVKIKNKKAICEKVSNGQDSLGIRIPKCWFTEIVQAAEVPFVTTSVNISGQVPVLKVAEIPKNILAQADYVIDDEMSLNGKASTIIDIRAEEKILRK